MFVYADNAATTSVSKTALNAMMPFLTEDYGNPSSLYGFAQRAAEALAQFKTRRSEIMTRYRELTARLDRQRFFGAGRLLRAFPTLKSPEHSETLERLRRHLHGFGRGGWGRR